MKKELLSHKRKAEICTALKQIMQHKDIQKITIQEIADKCGISRYTFYYHFTDIYDCLSWSLQEDLRAHSKYLGERPTWEAIVSTFILIIQQNRAAYRHLLSSSQIKLLHNAFCQEVRPLMQLCITGLMDDHKYQATDEYEAFLTDFFTAVLELLCVTLIQENMSDADDLPVAFLHTILDENLDGVLSRAEQQAFCSKVDYIPQQMEKLRSNNWNYLL